MGEIGDIRRRIARVQQAATARVTTSRPDFSRYRGHPIAFVKEVIGVETLWDSVSEILTGVHEPPYQLSVDSGHGTGKTFSLALLTNYWYWTTDQCWVITTAPTERDVKDALWTEIRLQQQHALKARNTRFPPDLMPAACEMRSSDDHVAKGYTARDANSAQGRHRKNMLFVFDEKEGVATPFWDGMKSMFRPGSGDAAVVVGNPFTTTTRAYFEHCRTRPDGSPVWRRIRLSSLDHPNIAAGLRGDPYPIPQAVTCEQVDNWVADWCDPVVPGDERATDIRWRARRNDETGDWEYRVYRPGPVGEPRILGRRPSSEVDGVWSEAVFLLTLGPPQPAELDILPIIGCDVAGLGDDFTCVHARCGATSLTHEAGSGWSAGVITDRLCRTAEGMAAWFNKRRPPEWPHLSGERVQLNVEDDMQGRAVQERLRSRGFNVVAVNASHEARRDDLYPNRRSELWFTGRNRAATGGMNFSLLPRDVRERLQQQLLAPKWAPDDHGRRVVEKKEVTKKKLGRSPDDADAALYAYWQTGDGGIVTVPRPELADPRAAGLAPPTARDWAAQRGVYGLKPGGM